MKTYCISCKKPISPLDFYVDSRRGKICSDCLVTQAATMSGTVGKKVGRPGVPPKAKKAAPERPERLDVVRLVAVNME